MAAEHHSGEKSSDGGITATSLWRTSSGSEPFGKQEMKKHQEQAPSVPLVRSQTTRQEHLSAIVPDAGVYEGVHREAISVTASHEVPNNNSGSQGIDHVIIPVNEVSDNNSRPQGVDQVAILVRPPIPVTASHEILNNNSGSQGVDHVAIPGSASFETSNNSGPQAGNNDNDWKLAALGGFADCMTGVAAILYNPPSSDETVYLLGLGIVLTAGLAEMLTALWVARDARNRGTAGRRIIYVSLFMLVLGIALDVFAYMLKK